MKSYCKPDLKIIMLDQDADLIATSNGTGDPSTPEEGGSNEKPGGSISDFMW